MDLHLGFANVRDPWELGQVHVTERVLFSGLRWWFLRGLDEPESAATAPGNAAFEKQ